jgi:hypothetical protein
MSAPLRDETSWPIVVVRMPADEISAVEWKEYLGTLGSWIARHEPFVIVMDLRHARPLDAKQRQALGEEVRRRGATDRSLAGLAHIVDNPFLRGVLTAVAWIARPGYPVKAFATEADARDSGGCRTTRSSGT